MHSRLCYCLVRRQNERRGERADKPAAKRNLWNKDKKEGRKKEEREKEKKDSAQETAAGALITAVNEVSEKDRRAQAMFACIHQTPLQPLPILCAPTTTCRPCLSHCPTVPLHPLHPLVPQNKERRKKPTSLAPQGSGAFSSMSVCLSVSICLWSIWNETLLLPAPLFPLFGWILTPQNKNATQCCCCR